MNPWTSRGILAKISGVIADNHANIVHVQAETSESGEAAVIHSGIQIQNLRHLEKVVRGLRAIPGLLKVERVKGAPRPSLGRHGKAVLWPGFS